MFKCRVGCCVTSLLLFVFCTGLRAQNDGRVKIEKSGIALVKSQPWSPVDQAQPMKFIGFFDRRTRSAQGGGYFIFSIPKGGDQQIEASRVVAFFTSPEIPPDIVEQSQRDELQKRMAEIKATIAKVPQSASALETLTAPIKEAVSRYDAGEVRVGGQWTSKADYSKTQLMNAEIGLENDFREAPKKSQFGLLTNSIYLKLKESSKGDPELAARLSKLESDNKTVINLETRSNILQVLSIASTSRESADASLEALKKLPDHDSQSRRVLASYDQALVIRGDVESCKLALEKQMGEGEEVPQTSETLTQALTKLSAKFAEFRASAAPPAIFVPSATFSALLAINDATPQLKMKYDAKDFRAVESTLSELLPKCALVGPKTTARLGQINTIAKEKIARFEEIRARAKVHADTGNNPLAVQIYTEALSVMPSDEIEAEIARLK